MVARKELGDFVSRGGGGSKDDVEEDAWCGAWHEEEEGLDGAAGAEVGG